MAAKPTPHRRDYNAEELALIKAGHPEKAKVLWTQRNAHRLGRGR